MSTTMDGRHPDDLAFPTQVARTRGFRSGRPRDARVSPDGSRVLFLRSPSADDPVNALWMLDVATGAERVVFDPAADEARLTDAERARRERAREMGGGIVSYGTDADFARALFVTGGRLHVLDLASGAVRELPSPGTPDGATFSPDGRRIASVVDGTLLVQDVEGGEPRVLATDPSDDVSWGLAEFAAAEEMRRFRGFWWSPDGAWIAAARVDESPVETWWISDPTEPSAAPRPMRYPRAGTPNAIVTLHLLEVDGDRRVDVRWDEPARFEYLAAATWSAGTPLTLLVQSRDQRESRVLEVDAATGATRVVAVETDPDWIELLSGTPTRLGDGRLVTAVQSEDTRRIAVDGTPATPAGLQVLSLIAADGDAVWFTGTDEPFDEHVHVLRGGTVTRLSDGDGLHAAAVGGGTVVLRSLTAEDTVPRVRVLREGAAPDRSWIPRRATSRSGPARSAPRCSPRADASPTARSRCCSVPTADRTRCRRCAGGAGSWRSSGSRTASARRCSSSTVGERRRAGSRGSARSHATSR